MMNSFGQGRHPVTVGPERSARPLLARAGRLGRAVLTATGILLVALAAMRGMAGRPAPSAMAAPASSVSAPVPLECLVTQARLRDSKFGPTGLNAMMAFTPTSATILSDLPDPSYAGELVTVNFSVTSASGTPTGTVTIYGGGALCQTTLPTSTCQLGMINAGSEQTITIQYNGNKSQGGNFSGSRGETAHEVLSNTSTAAVTSYANPSGCNSILILTATVTGDPPAHPSVKISGGTVTFYDDGNLLGTHSLLKGVATHSITPALALPPGFHDITVEFSGSSGFEASTSPVYVLEIGEAETMVTLSSDVNPAIVGEFINYMATVKAVFPGTGHPTGGSVDFFDDGTFMATAPVDGLGVATLGTSHQYAGDHPITAEFSGFGGCYGPGTSPAFIQEVNTSATTNTLTVDINPAVCGQEVEFTSTIIPHPPASGMPTGVVTFTDGMDVIDLECICTGMGDFTIDDLLPGAHGIRAEYSGDPDFNPSISNILLFEVEKADADVTLSHSPASSTYGQPVLLTANVSAVAPGNLIPVGGVFGTVSFYDDGMPLGTSTVDAFGEATLNTTAISIGSSNSLTAVFHGTDCMNTETSPAESHTVMQAGTTTSLVSAPNPSICGQTRILTATVTADPPGGGIPVGTVTFKDGVTPLGTVALDAAGKAVFTTAALLTGAHTLSADYSGNVNYFSDSSPGLGATVTAASTATSLATSRNPAMVGTTVYFTATVTVTPPGPSPATGTVTFKDGASTIGGPLALDGTGKAYFSTSSLTLGTHPITAVFNGTTCLGASTSPVVSQVIRDEVDLAVVKTDSPDPVQAGFNITYLITVTNNGPIASDMTMTDTLPSIVTFVSLSAPGGWSCSGTSTRVCSKSAVPSGTSETITLVVKVPAATAANTRIDNTARVGGPNYDPGPANNQSTTQTTVFRSRFTSYTLD